MLIAKSKSLTSVFMAVAVLGGGALWSYATPEADEKPKPDKELILGTWIPISGEQNGAELAEEKLKGGKLIFTDEKVTLHVLDARPREGTYTIDPDKTPKEIDILDGSGKVNEQTKLGIYELDGETYKFCLAPASKPRPTEFTSKPGSGHSLGLSRREKP